MLRHEMRIVARRLDNLASAREAGSWLSTLTRDSEIACEEVASALSKSEQFGPFSAERHQAVLLVDKWAAPLQEQLLSEYPFAGGERAGRLAAILNRVSKSFGRYYDELMEALRVLPHDRLHTRLSYVTLVRRLAHLRYECVLHALGHEPALSWRKVHRLHRIATRHQARGNDPALEGEQRAAALGTSAESEYIQILLTHQLAGRDLDSAAVLCAVGWLAEWAAALSITTEPASRNSFAIYPAGTEGLAAPPEVLTAGLLWLDLTPLHREIRRELSREEAQDEPDEGFGLSREKRIALLKRLLSEWSGPRGSDARREPRRPIRRAVQVAFGLPDIACAMRLSESFTRETGRGGEESGATQAYASPLERWLVADASDSGCRIRGSRRAVAAIDMGTLIAIRIDGNDTWIVGFIRRRGEVTVDTADLGVQILSTRLRLLALEDAARAEGSAAVPPRPALLLSPGAGSRTSVRQTVLIGAGDYAPGRVYFCETKRHRYKLLLEQDLERQAHCVWATLSTAKIAPLGTPVTRTAPARGPEDTILTL